MAFDRGPMSSLGSFAPHSKKRLYDPALTCFWPIVQNMVEDTGADVERC